jgi:two-component sensor histidine kinase
LEGYRNGNEVRIILSDNGRGFPKASFTAQEGLGFQIVHVLAEQLEGSIAYERKNGSRFSITFTG